jgi:hypothetical protein
MGVDDADAVVRRDVLGRQPAIAARLLGRTLSAALRERLDPATLLRDAQAAMPRPMRSLSGADDDALAAYAAFVAGRVLDAALDVITTREKADSAGKALPGWRLVERPATGDGQEADARRLIVTPDNVTAG